MVVGGVVIYPSVTMSAEYNDNIFATTDAIGDLIATLTPTVQVQSNWSRNALSLSATDTSTFYDRHSSENTSNYSVSASGRLDILTNSGLTAGLSIGHFAISRSSENTFNVTLTPIQYNELSANIGGVQTLNRLQFSERFSFARVTYQNNTDVDGAPIFFDQLDNNAFVISGQANYAISPAVAIFVSAAGNDRVYDVLPPATSLNRDSDGFETTVGADFDVTRLVRGQIQVGYLAQYYASPEFHTVSGPAFHARVEYYPTGLTTLTLHLDHGAG